MAVGEGSIVRVVVAGAVTVEVGVIGTRVDVDAVIFVGVFVAARGSGVMVGTGKDSDACNVPARFRDSFSEGMSIMISKRIS